MTEKQKQAISLLNRLKDNMSEEEYFLLLDFIVISNPVYVPSYPTYPYITWDSKPIPLTCGTGNMSKSGDLTFKEEGK